MSMAYISLGSNLHEPQKQLALAREGLSCLADIAVTGASSVYLTEPQGLRDQPWFANQILALNCAPHMTAFALLDLLAAQEQTQGRTRSTDPMLRYGPRVIDLDVLLFGTQYIQCPRLQVPHPRLCQRAFILVPLVELVSDLRLPQGTLVRECLDALTFTVDGNRIFQ